MCWNFDYRIIYILIYVIGLCITYYLFNKKMYKLYKESNLKISYNDWLNCTEWIGVFLLLPFCWPIVITIFIITYIVKIFKNYDS
jgi:hypothetical protein